MSNELMNIVKILVVLFVCLFVYNTAFGKTMTMVVDGKPISPLQYQKKILKLKKQRKNPIANNTYIMYHTFSQCMCHENDYIW